jgi:Flp pilus assembly protein TadD
MMRHRWIFLMKVSCDLRIDGQALQKMRLGLMCLVIALLIGLNSAHAQSDGSEMLPMFGQPKIARPDNLKQADEAFIRDTTLRYGSRQAASNALATQGWAAIRAKQGDVAMQRFNQAWLLNPKNYSVFWGFGAVLSERGKLAEAIEQLEAARELVDDSTQRIALLCDLGTVHSEYAARMPAEKELERAHHFVVANNRFTESLELNPKYAPSWREWAISLYAQERYSEAWVRVRQARALDADPFPPEFLKKLSEKMSEPK